MIGNAGGHVAHLLICWLVRRAQRTPPVDDPLTNARLARYTGAARVFAWALLGIGAAFGGFLTFKVPVAGQLACASVTLVFTGLMAATVLDFSRVSLRWNENRIVFNSPWRGERALGCADFDSVQFSPTLGWFVLSEAETAWSFARA